MNAPQKERAHLPHDFPFWVDPAKEVYYLTINCQQRGPNQLAGPSMAPVLLETVAFRQKLGLWFAYLFLVMPDHVHGLVSFPPSKRTIQGVVILEALDCASCWHPVAKGLFRAP